MTVTYARAVYGADTATRRILQALADSPEGLPTPALAAVMAAYHAGKHGATMALYEAGARARVTLYAHERGGNVRRTGLARTGRRGSPAMVWQITEQGRAAL